MRWSPMGELEGMRRRMGRMLEEMIGRHPLEEEMTLDAFVPAVDVYTTDQEVVVCAELPGLDAKDVSVEISENRAIVMGQTSRTSEAKQENYFRSERSFGSFRRAVLLPERVKEAEATAKFENGILTIRAPRLEPAEHKAHKIPIAASQEGQGIGAAPEEPRAQASGQVLPDKD